MALDPSWLTSLLLVATRLTGLLLFTPLLGFTVAPARVRVLAVLSLAAIIQFALPPLAVSPNSAVELALAAGREFVLGMIFGFGVLASFAALSFGGQLLDVQIGFNAAALFDYSTQTQTPLLGSFFSTVGVVVFLSLNAHHELLKAVAQTFVLMPPGEAVVRISAAQLIRAFGFVFLYGFIIFSPVILGVLLLDVAAGFISRTMPQLNIYFVTLPLKIFWGVLLLAVSAVSMGPTIRSLFEQSTSMIEGSR